MTPRHRMQGREIGRACAIATAAAAAWLILADSMAAPELAAAIAAGAATAAADLALRRRTQFRARFDLRLLPGALLGAWLDTWTLVIVLAERMAGRAPESTFQSFPFEISDETATDVGRRVAAVYFTALQPNSVVVGFDRNRQRIIVHQLRPDGESPVAETLKTRR